ncbi:hybrid sensor histidine kinase/response regulator [Roseibium salinum]|uniref:hybrid sensor histidine kinase/response regulator n=1 Tax=Roseibium salinum TaxID=1604349 RepID=UPI00361BAB19
MADHDDDSVELALLAHDLRTPLAAMRLTAELIGNALNKAQTEQLAILVRSIDALTQMTGELIKAAEPGTSPESAPVRIADIVSDVAGLFQAAAGAKNLLLETSVEDAARDCLTRHGGALRRVLATLVDNAVKYTPEGGVRVEIRALAPDDAGRAWVSVAVADSGPGIDAAERARLFRPFVRGRHGRETGPGTGLGLWGTEHLVREIGGALQLTRSETGGSRFEVEVPCEGQGTGDAAPATATRRPAALPHPAHVLIVDDNDTNCRLLEALLESFGITSQIANSGEQAIEMVGKGSFDAALLDLHMPGMSGVETAEELRHLRSEADLPLIAVTAAAESVSDERLRQVGFQDVLTKPLSPAALFEALEVARQARRRREDQDER